MSTLPKGVSFGGTRTGVKTHYIQTEILKALTTVQEPIMATKQGVHRSTPNSKSGRRMINIGKEPEGKLTPEQIAWNAAVDAKRALRKQAKLNSGVN